jgi:hypothetical protein
MSRQQSRNADHTELQMLVPSPNHPIHDTSNHEGDQTQANKPHSQDRSRNKRRLPQGWRFGVVCCAISTSIVCLLNFAGTVWGLTHQGSGRGVLFDGDCQKVQRINTVSHLLINLLGTVLLSSSNYCMQCLSGTNSSLRSGLAAVKHVLDTTFPYCLGHILCKQNTFLTSFMN